jgi:hypothetical protein
LASQNEIFPRLFEPPTYPGPGSASSIQPALVAIPGLPGEAGILAVGCGSHVFYIVGKPD